MAGERRAVSVSFGGVTYAVIVRAGPARDGIEFLTPPDYSQQLALISHPAGRVIPAHVHNKVTREVLLTQEVLVLRSGRLRVDFYDDARAYLGSKVLAGGDVILLARGGHGFQALEPVDLIEVKQGPYSGDVDKTRFAGIEPAAVRMVED